MQKQEFIAKLNEDLESEYRSIVQYIQHINSVKGPEYQNILDELRGHLSQEVEHAMTLAGQIDFLGGTPSGVIAPFKTKTDPQAALKQDLQLEEEQLDRYRARVTQADELGLPDVAEALAPLLEQTQDHVHDLRAALEAR